MCRVRGVGGVDAAMQVRSTARRIERYAGDYGFALEELEALEVDLLDAEQRLLKGSYGGKRQGSLRIPDRTEELFSDVGFYWSAGQVWKSLLAALRIKESGRVAEVACGVVPKVGGALHYGAFNGTLDLVDLSEDALSRASRWLTLIGCRFPHRSLCSSLFDLKEQSYEGIFANHVIDDLLLYTHCKKSGVSLQELLIDGTRYVEMWRSLINSTIDIPTFVKVLVDVIATALTPGGIVVMCDYDSHSHCELGLEGITLLVQEVQSQVRNEFFSLGLRSLEELVPEQLASDRFQLRRNDVVAFCKVGGGV